MIPLESVDTITILTRNRTEKIPDPVDLHHGHDQPLFHAVVRKGVDDGFPGNQCAGEEDSYFHVFSFCVTVQERPKSGR